MKLNKTQAAVLRAVFGSNDTNSERGAGISCGPTNMAVRTGSREHKFGLELERIGVATVFMDNLGLLRIKKVRLLDEA